MPKSPRVYLLIVAAWSLTVAAAAPALIGQVTAAYQVSGSIAGLAAASGVFIAYFWLNGVKDVVYTLHYHLVDRRAPRTVPRRTDRHRLPRVVLVYCTCDDFCAESLLRSMAQRYANFEAVILDDSSRPEYRAAIDKFAADQGVRVVRRDGRGGFKAGNLNNYLRSARFDYFVVLDSDEIIPPDYIDRCLDYFAHYPSVGIVQANHTATRNRNAFMRTFAAGVDSHWIAYQTVKHRFGFLSLLGHGAMVSRECYTAAGGFPYVVAEDLCFSIVARGAGYYAAFAPDVHCEEEFPVNYLAFKKRHSKWTQGNMEFIKKYTGVILRSRMRWFEKLDIFLFTYNLPLTALFSLYVAIHVIVLPALGYSIVYPLWMLAPTVLFLLAPMLNDIIFHFRRMRALALLSYLAHSVLLFGSMLVISLRSSITATFGKSTFVVTPKHDTDRTTWRRALRANLAEIGFGLGLAAASLWLTGSVLPVVLLVLPALLCCYLTVKHNSGRDHPAPTTGEPAAGEPANATPRPRRPAAAETVEETPVAAAPRS